MRSILWLGTASAVALLNGPRLAAQVTADPPAARADAVVDLMTSRGVQLVRGQWRYRDAEIVEVDHRSPGADLKPSGPPNRTHDIVPKAGGLDFDDSNWEAFDGPDLVKRRTNGRLAFGWYRFKLTVPERVGPLDPTGTTIVFEVTVDDYAEIWVDGKLMPVLGQAGGQLIKGWNAANRVVVGRDVRAGQVIQLAIFGANGPLSEPPANYVWVRSATLDFYKSATVGSSTRSVATVTRLDPELDRVVPAGAELEKLGGDSSFSRDRSGIVKAGICSSAIPTPI